MADTDSKTVVVTGGRGFVGHRLVAYLLDEGWRVVSIDNNIIETAHELPEHKQLTEYNVDIRDTDELTDIFEQERPRALIHLAAHHFIPFCNANPREATDNNIYGTESVLTAAKAVAENLERVVVTSSAAVYTPSETPHKEAEAAADPVDIYGMTKRANEHQAYAFSFHTNVPTYSVRLFNVYGPGETNPHLIPEIVDQLKAGETDIELGNPNPRRSFVHIDDVSRAYTAMLDTAPSTGYDVLNLGSAEEYSAAELIDIFNELAPFDVTYHSDESRIRKSDRPRLKPDLMRIADVLGWQEQYNMRTGLKELLETEGVNAN